MSNISRLAFIGNSLPRLCGIATFTNDLQRSVADARPELHTRIVAMIDPGQTYAFPPSVGFSVREDHVEDYRRAAAELNAGAYDAVCLQHEFGIFGGEAGGDVMAMLEPLEAPLVATLHTVLADPTRAQHDVLRRIIELSSKVVVMAEKGRDLLQSVYGAAPGKIAVIPHGIPDAPFRQPDEAKAKYGFLGKTVLLTFGLLSPSKGVDVMIEAMPEILKERPDAVYVILGATHPVLKRRQGEAYRHTLVERVKALGLEDHVVFLDQFVDQATLLEFICLCDVYVTPYRNEAQLTSGTLAYSFGLGKAIVSTPYWHARELLADGRGVLVAFDDPSGFGRAVTALLADEPRRQAMGRRAYASSRSMSWPRTARRYLEVIDEAGRQGGVRPVAAAPRTDFPAARSMRDSPPPVVRIGHLLSMCDDTGILQHAVHAVPDRGHGYCVDDNARALLLACRLNRPGEQGLPDVLASRFAAFVQHAWNPETQRFRNFMSFERLWLEARGSEDSHGRALWALGECARFDANVHRRRWACGLFRDALPAVERFDSPRSWAFALLGLNAYLADDRADPRAERLRGMLADRLMGLLLRTEGPGWVWFEGGLAYDNARLAEALILTGSALPGTPYLEAGLKALRWLTAIQTTPAGLFRPVGTESFSLRRERPRAFDQQPLEAAAAIAACLAAARAAPRETWQREADRAFAWFMGGNDLSAVMVDPHTGGCRDGLHPDRPNENQGAESVLSYLLGLADMRQLARMGLGSAQTQLSLALRA